MVKSSLFNSGNRIVIPDMQAMANHELQHVRLPSSSPTPAACSNSCPPSPWCYLTVSSSVIPFSSCLQSFPTSGGQNIGVSACHPTISSSVIPFSSCLQSFPTSSGQNIGVSASTSVLPVNTQDWSPLGWTGWISSLLQHHSSKASILQCSAFFIVHLSYS